MDLTWRARSTSAGSGYWSAPAWTKRWRGGRRLWWPVGRRWRCGRFTESERRHWRRAKSTSRRLRVFGDGQRARSAANRRTIARRVLHSQVCEQGVHVVLFTDRVCGHTGHGGPKSVTGCWWLELRGGGVPGGIAYKRGEVGQCPLNFSNESDHAANDLAAQVLIALGHQNLGQVGAHGVTVA